MIAVAAATTAADVVGGGGIVVVVAAVVVIVVAWRGRNNDSTGETPPPPTLFLRGNVRETGGENLLPPVPVASPTPMILAPDEACASTKPAAVVVVSSFFRLLEYSRMHCSISCSCSSA